MFYRKHELFIVVVNQYHFGLETFKNAKIGLPTVPLITQISTSVHEYTNMWLILARAESVPRPSTDLEPSNTTQPIGVW